LVAQLAATFGSEGNQFTMDFRLIGNPGNSTDTTGAPNPAGSVARTYYMGKYEVSRDMIEKANAEGTLGITMADMTSFGGNGVNRPATGVSWYEAATFVNWLNTSSGKAAAYKFSGGSFALWESGDSGYDAANPYRNSLATYFLPGENEWYKGAYYSSGGVYYDYPTGSDSAPTAVAGGTTAGTAVYNQPWGQGPADITSAGGVSPYGTMGQGGNVWEWMESALDGSNDSTGEFRGLRGGYWFDIAYSLGSWDRTSNEPAFESYNVGFRVAAVPEPLEGAGVIGVAALGFALWRRRGSL
jgi:formylglycine-generating enzyme required for sulfatase activity